MPHVSAWTATVQSEIDSTQPLREKKTNDFRFSIHLTGNSLWMVVSWPDESRMAFRCAYTPLNDFELISLSEKNSHYLVRFRTVTGDFETRVEIPGKKDQVLHYATAFTPSHDLLIPFSPRDIVPLTKNGDIENTFGKIHLHQVGARSGQLFFSMTKPSVGSVFYFQDLSSLNDFCQDTQTSAAETVGGEWPEIGFRLPPLKDKPLKAGKKVLVSDAYIVCSTDIPGDETEISTSYLEYLSNVYLKLPKPPVVYHDWPGTAEKSLDGLTTHKGCWTFHKGHSYLSAYVSDYKTPPESMVQLAVLIPLMEYAEWQGEKPPVIETLKASIPNFYDSRYGTIVRWLPAMYSQLDQSEEQKKEDVMDSWYLYHPLMNLVKLARTGDAEARRVLLASMEFTIRVAKHFDYEWPVFYHMHTLEAVKEETEPGKGGEKDVPGSYAHLMLEVWELTGEDRFLREAAKAAKKLKGLGMELFYQANNTAFAAGALVRLYKESGDEDYLKQSYVCIAALVKNMQLWECRYGHSAHYPNFFSIFPLNNAPYTAAYEEFEVYTAIHAYLQETKNLKILPALNILLPEFIKYAVHRMPYYYPPLLPEDMLAPEVKTGEIDPNLWMPLEDLYDGWDNAGQVGQEVYGAGTPFGVVPRQYFKFRQPGLLLFIDYPVSSLRRHKNHSVSFRVGGSAELCCTLRLFSEKGQKFKVMSGPGKQKKLLEPVKQQENWLEYEIAGNSQLHVSW
ncbi:MAG: hypothetical protein K0R65_1428 [Crocinitomicaceae bacterium]|jgi:hypothetical protein|nr:hypothetical protein [Crocinitomicaceae bacterium]